MQVPLLSFAVESKLDAAGSVHPCCASSSEKLLMSMVNMNKVFLITV
jgi:hypothetical protein